MKSLLFAPLALAALLVSTAADAAPRPPHHFSPREQAHWQAQHQPALRPVPHHAAPRPQLAPAPAYHYHRGDPLPTHRVTRLPLHPAAPLPAYQPHR